MQHAITHEASTRTPEPWRTLQAAYIPKTGEESGFLNIKDMNLNQILRAISQKRMAEHTSLRKAAESLDIDLRTLQKYAQWEEKED